MDDVSVFCVFGWSLAWLLACLLSSRTTPSLACCLAFSNYSRTQRVETVPKKKCRWKSARNRTKMVTAFKTVVWPLQPRGRKLHDSWIYVVVVLLSVEIWIFEARERAQDLHIYVRKLHTVDHYCTKQTVLISYVLFLCACPKYPFSL